MEAINNTITLQRVCPICGGSTAEPLCSIRFAPVENENLPDAFTVAACHSCGFIFDDMRSRQEDFDTYYSNTIKYKTIGSCGSGGDSNEDIIRYTQLYDFLHEHMHRETKILDIGAGKCGFLRFLSSRGFKNLTAVEPSVRGNDHAAIQVCHSINQLREREREREDLTL